ncbi:hypothetical protein C8F01DRAFT_1257851 [Mycena amicta]|nr:hypothetical protein C8F01DRAFT_1257851 [Mycena amicta]
MACPTPRPRQRTSDIDLSKDIPLSAGISVADSEDSHHSQAGEVILGKRNRAASEESGRSAPPLRNLAGDVIPSPLNASNLEGPSQPAVLDRVLARIISGDVYRLPQVLREMLKEEYYPGYALYALHTRDHARRSTCQILRPRKPAEELAWIIRLELPPSLAAAIIAIADLAAAYIWGCLPNRSLTVSGPHNPARNLVPVSDSAALSALADICIALARAFWSDNTPYIIQSHRSELFALGSDLPPMKKDVASEDLCSISGTVMSYAIKFTCGCAFCFVCARSSFDDSFKCTACQAIQYRPPIAALDIRARIRARLLPDVDTSRIKYSWETLQFPMAPRPHIPHEAEVCEKQRLRMAAKRAQRKCDPALLEEDQVRVRAQNRKYRERHPDRVADYERRRRDRDMDRNYGRKHGQDALEMRLIERRLRKEAKRQADEAEEEMQQAEKRERRRQRDEVRQRKLALQQEMDAENNERTRAARSSRGYTSVEE